MHGERYALALAARKRGHFAFAEPFQSQHVQ
jgi:hypothetical protein